MNNYEFNTDYEENNIFNPSPSIAERKSVHQNVTSRHLFEIDDKPPKMESIQTITPDDEQQIESLKSTSSKKLSFFPKTKVMPVSPRMRRGTISKISDNSQAKKAKEQRQQTPRV